MGQLDTFERLLAALYEAMLDDARWLATSALIDEACGTKGHALFVGEGLKDDIRVTFGQLCYRGQSRADLAREYLETYHPTDERVPRVRRLPDSHLVHLTDLYTEQELKTSRTYNEFAYRNSCQDGLSVRLDGPEGSHISWVTADPVAPAGWGSAQLATIKRLLPYIRQFVRVRQALGGAGALGASLTALLDNTRLGVIHLDRRGRIVTANDRARGILRRGDGLCDQDGCLGARLPADHTRLEELLARALSAFGGQTTSGSMTIWRASGLPRLVVHVNPVGVRHPGFDTWRVAALVLVVEPGSPARIDPALVASALGLTPAESRVAAALAEGNSVRDIAQATGRQDNSVRFLLKKIYKKQDISRQADLVRLVLSIAGFSGSRS